jgi:hypothetical protein
MSKRGSAWTKLMLAMIPLFFVTGCVSAVNQSAICDGTAASRTAHAAALAQDGGDLSVVTGTRLIRQLDAGCGG